MVDFDFLLYSFYFLLFPKTIGTSRIIQLHFVKIIRSHQTIEYEEEKVQEKNPIEPSLKVVEFIKDIERDIAKGLALDLFEESSVWTKNSHDHILEEEEILEEFQKMFLKGLFDHFPLFRDILYLLDLVPIRFTTYFWRTL